MKRKVAALALFSSVTVISPAHAYTLYTMAIEDYDGNGAYTPIDSHDSHFNITDADQMGAKLSNLVLNFQTVTNWTWQWRDTNTGVGWRSFHRYSGDGLPYITQVDMAYFAGHSTESGPDLGNGVGYNKDTFGTYIMNPAHYYQWSLGSLKWFLNRACLMLRYSSDTDPWNSGSNPLKRFKRCFDAVITSENDTVHPRGSLHAILGSCSDTYSAGYSVGKDFFSRCYGPTGPQAIGPSWMNAMYTQAYDNCRLSGAFGWVTGIKPAIMCTYTYGTSSTTPNVDYYNEKLSAPYADPSYYWNSTPLYTDLKMYWVTYGTPKYYERLE